MEWGGKNFYQMGKMIKMTHSTGKSKLYMCVFNMGGVVWLSGFLFLVITHQDYFTI